MDRNDLEELLIEKAIDGTLSAEEAEAFEVLAQERPALADRVRRETELHGVLRAAAPDRFTPFFDQKVMRRLAEAGRSGAEAAAQQIEESLAFVFRRLAVPAVAACLLLAVTNVYQAQSGPFGSELSVAEAMFGLPPTGLEAALIYQDMP